MARKVSAYIYHRYIPYVLVREHFVVAHFRKLTMVFKLCQAAMANSRLALSIAKTGSDHESDELCYLGS